ncbi:MAG: ATP-grasp domain-containing protein, partial [bacterium]|nr:ATP-grasp domain-containing protein [bacterium]
QTIAEKEINYVFPASDVEINYFNGHRQWFKKISTRFMVQEPHIIDTFMDKYNTVEFFKINNLPFPGTYLPSQYNGQLGFPLILKKRRGSGGLGLVKVTENRELDFYLERSGGEDMILQEYIPGDNEEYTSALFNDGKNTYTITFKRTLAPGGFSQHVELISGTRISQFLEKLTGVLDFRGSLNIQYRLTEKGCIPFEINPRFSSTVYFRHYFGFMDVAWSTV